MAILLLMRKILLLVYLLSLTTCTGLFFYPQKTLLGTPADIGIKYEEINFQSVDGTKLNGWFLPTPGTPHATLLFLHGNAENISTHLGSVFWLPAQGIQVFLFDYRGYGLSEGSPSPKECVDDAVAALDTLYARADVDPRSVLIFGQSLGGTFAPVALAKSSHKHEVRGLIMESPFAGFRQIAREKLGSVWLTYLFQYPLSFLIENQLNPEIALSELEGTPVLFMHGDADFTVPWHHSAQLFAAAKEPKEFWTNKGGGHISAFADEQTRRRFVEWIKVTAR